MLRGLLPYNKQYKQQYNKPDCSQVPLIEILQAPESEVNEAFNDPSEAGVSTQVLGNESLFTLESSKSVSDDNGDESGMLTGPINDPSEAGELSKSLGNESLITPESSKTKSDVKGDRSILLIGDSIIKNIYPRKLSRRKVNKRTFPGKTAEEIISEVKNIKSDPPSHIILHAGTNNLPVDNPNVCIKKIESLAMNINKKFPNSTIGISSITLRRDLNLEEQVAKVNDGLQVFCTKNEFKFIDNRNLDSSCLNGSLLHLNAKGSAYLAANFIKFFTRKHFLCSLYQPKTKTQPGFSQQNSTAELSGGHSEYDVESPKTQQPFKEVLTEPWCDPIKISSDDNNNINNQFSLTDLNNLKGLKIACLNINSLSKHIDELRVVMLNNPLDILAINESKINESVSDDEISVSGFHLIRKDRNRHGGGVLMYIRETIPFSERNNLQTACSLEMLCVEISRPCSRPFLVTTWYRPPGSDARLFDDFENFLSRCDLENKELLLMGDLNCDVSKFPPDAHTRRLQFISCVYQLEQLINEPTRVTRTSATLIDLIFTNKKENIVKSGVIHLGISDHSLIFAVRKFFTPKSRQNARYVRNFKNFNATVFLNDLSQIPWENVAQYENPNSCWQLWKSFYLQILDRHAPFRCMRIRANSLPWITPNIKNLMKARDFHKKKAVKFNSQVHWAKYKDTRNKVNSELYKAKKRYFCDKFEDCAQTKDPKQSWHHINHLLGRNFKSNNIPQLKIGDTIISDNLMIAEAFNDFFVSIGPKLSAEIVHDAQDLSENPSTSPVTLFTLSEISEYEVFLLLSNLKTSKSTGMDSIPARVLKISAEIISPSLTWIFNLCIKTGVYIDDWKKAWVVPIFKSEDRKKM